MNILLFVLCLVTSNVNHGVDGIQNFKENLEHERQLKFINKHLVKSIHVLLLALYINIFFF